MKGAYILLALLLIPLALGAITPITVKTVPSHNVTINIIEPATGNILKSYNALSDSSGLVSFSHESDYSGSIYLSVLVRNNGKLVAFNRTDNYMTGSSIFIDMIGTPVVPETPIVPVVNNTPVVEENITPEVATETIAQDNAGATTGSSVSILEKLKLNRIGKYAVYIIGIVIILGVLALLVFKVAVPYFGNSSIRKAEFAGYKTSTFETKPVGTEAEILTAETKLKEAQAEIERIKNKRNEIKQAEARFLQAKNDLERLKGEE